MVDENECLFCGCNPCVPEDHDVAIIRHGLDGHAGPGWYVWSEEYPDEGSVGAFASIVEAQKFATENGYRLEGA